MIHVHQLEGAVSRASADATAFGRRDPRYVTNVIGAWFDPTLQDAEIANVRATAAAVRSFSGGGAYLNFFDADEGDARIRAAYGDANYERLVALKDRYDPDNVFRLNQNIKPSRPA
jgi:FAD/FMN-containing dehydrogenase